MLPCRRRALLAKTAGFKKMPEDIQTNHKNCTQIYPKSIPKTIKTNSPRRFGKHFQTVIRQKHHPCDFRVPCWILLREILRHRRVVLAIVFSGPSRASPKAIVDAKMKEKESKGAKMELKRMLKLFKIDTKNMPEPI